MRLAGFVGYSGSGKTTLIEAVIALLRQAGQSVSTIKHAHHHFDIDQVGKDSWRHRVAGSYEVLIASDRRMVLQREYPEPAPPQVEALLSHLAPVDWVLFEGFKEANVAKIEVWRAKLEREPFYRDDSQVKAVITDDPSKLPFPTELPCLSLNDPQAVCQFLLDHPQIFHYPPASTR